MDVQRAHLILFVRDQAASARFYAAALDLAPSLDVPGMTEFSLPGGAILGLMPEAGITRLLGESIDPSRAQGVARAELYLIMDDVDRAWSRALAAGATAVSEPAPRNWGDRAGYLRDPDGHLLAFASRG